MAQSNNGDKHEILNVSMLVMLAYIFDKVIVYAPADCCSVLKKCLAQENEHFIKKITYRTNRYYSGFKYAYWVAAIQVLYAILKTSKDSVLFFSELNVCCFPICNIYSRITHQKMYTLCHRNLEELNEDGTSKRKNIQSRLSDYIFRKMSFAPQNRLLVLGEPIKNNLKQIVSAETILNIIPMLHPYYSCHTNEEREYNSKGTVHIGIVGMIKKKT